MVDTFKSDGIFDVLLFCLTSSSFNIPYLIFIVSWNASFCVTLSLSENLFSLFFLCLSLVSVVRSLSLLCFLLRICFCGFLILLARWYCCFRSMHPYTNIFAPHAMSLFLSVYMFVGGEMVYIDILALLSISTTSISN